MTHTATDTLDQDVADLARAIPDGYRGDLESVRDRLVEPRLRVLVAGEAKRGKSTLINALIGRDLLPTGALPLTAVPTTVIPGDDDRLEIRYLDGRQELRPLTDLPQFVTERANPRNEAGIVEAIATIRAAGAGHPVEFVDTPGVGSVFQHNTDTARRTYRTLDAVIVVLTTDPPITAAERDLLTELAGTAVRTFIVLNKVDRLESADLADIVRFTATVCAQAGVEGSPWPLSARTRDAGFERFATEFRRYLDAGARIDVRRALARQVRAVALAASDDVRIRRRSLELTAEHATEQIRRFGDRIAALRRDGSDLDDRITVFHTGRKRELSSAAAELGRDLSARCLSEVKRYLDGLAPETAAQDVEASAHAVASAIIGDTVTGWRSDRAQQLEQQMREFVVSVQQQQAEQIVALTSAARELLDVELAGVTLTPALDTGHGFWLDFRNPPAWEPPGAELVRRHRPGARRRARARVLAEIPDQVDKQIGRARSDLQSRLDETVRRLHTQLRAAHLTTLDRVSTAAAQYTEASIGDDADRAQLHDRLTADVQVLTTIADRLARLDDALRG